ncbi:ATP-binding protein [Sulfurimonas sp.]|uniref:ATP-binding protein n=1 Tax=Sulfurimonas sp. TaxID=2022749 RepID=UPI0026181231|nr:ATP-binding protein [Sulfurimonas sp.]MCW8894676.1 ATP-binding protein [Sulfurimonas sp.]MCW9067616.1 ATP-binding protein [Sulfurimonas sp.]
MKKNNNMLSLRNRYIPAMLLVAILSVFAYINVERIIDSIENDSSIINTSGRQRMLSQNLILLAIKYLDSPTQENRQTLEKNIKLMKDSHNYLLNKDKNTRLKIIYDEKKLSIKLNTFLNELGAIVNHKNKEIITKISADAEHLLPLLSEAVQEYENINNLKVANLKQTQLYILIITLALLILEVIFIFHPASKQIKKNSDELKELNSNLQKKVKEEIDKNRKKEEHLIQQSRMAQMGEMIAMIAHQWRQPLGAISSINSTIEVDAMLDSLDKDATIKNTNKISKLVQHLSQTIDDFREFFKPNKQKQKTNCDEAIANTLNIVGNSLKTKNITLKKELNCNEDFHTHRNELIQVVLNLIKNAEDALLENEIKDPYIKLSSYNENEKNIIEVSDNAGGIPNDIIEKIFDSYFSTKKEKDGTGLGLYMSKTIIEDHCGGKLTVFNNTQGAVFQISLPQNN